MTVLHRTCVLCEATCGVDIEVGDDGVISSIRGDELDGFSRGYICPKATALKDLHEDRDRLRQPMRRTAGGWEPISWDDAFDYTAERLRAVQEKHGRDAVGVFQGNAVAHNLGLLLYAGPFFQGLGTRNRFSSVSTDTLPLMLSSWWMFGNAFLFPVPDIVRTSYFLIIGANPLVSNGSAMGAPGVRKRLKELQARGGKVVVVDPRRTETAAAADRHVFIRPGTDVFLLWGIVHVLFAENLVRLGRLEAVVRGLDEIRTLAREFSPETAADRTGVPASEIRRLARELVTHDRAVCYGRIGTSTQEFGTQCTWLINVINVLTGRLDRVGGAMFTSPAADLVSITRLLGSYDSFDTYRSRSQGLPEFGGELPAAAMADEMLLPGDRQVRAFICCAGNPVLSTPNGRKLDRALAHLEFMVSLDPYINETSRHAHVILPGRSVIERAHYDLLYYAMTTRNVARYSPALRKASDSEKEDWEIIVELAMRMQTGPFARLKRKGWEILGALGEERLLSSALFFGPFGVRAGARRLTWKKLREATHGIDLGALRPQMPGRLLTMDKKIDLAPARIVRDVDRLRRVSTEDDGGALRLIGRRTLRSANSWIHNSPRLVKGRPRCTLLIHPEDAAARGIASGDIAIVSSKVGRVEVEAEVTTEILKGVVSLPHGWGHNRPGAQMRVAAGTPGASYNDVADERLVDELSGTAAFNGTRVMVEYNSSSAPSPQIAAGR